jgi:isoamylase
MFLNGDEITAPDRRGHPVVDDSFLLLFNAGDRDCEFRLPPGRFGRRWSCELRTDDPRAEPGAQQASAGEQLTVGARSLLLLRRA